VTLEVKLHVVTEILGMTLNPIGFSWSSDPTRGRVVPIAIE